MERVWTLLAKIRQEYQRILGPKLTGIYVHGSLAFGCFRWECSDIDFLVAAEEPLAQPEKEELIRTLLLLDAEAPEKGFEMSVVLRSACSPFADPTPYELHYSNAYRADYQRDMSGTCRRLRGFDADLAAHMTVVNHAGITLCGAPAETVFATVPRESYLRSLWYDVENAPQEIFRNPVYYVLNLCRVLAFAQEGLVLSKAQGGEWGMAHLTQDRKLIEAALLAYQKDLPISEDFKLCSFAEKVLLRIQQSDVFLSAGFKKH